MKTSQKLIDERLTIQEGHLKGARITPTELIIKELMEDYHAQFVESELASLEKQTDQDYKSAREILMWRVYLKQWKNLPLNHKLYRMKK
jgi:hypothetical protein